MAYQFIKENRKKYAVREMAGLFGVSSSAYYKWRRRGCRYGGVRPMGNWYVSSGRSWYGITAVGGCSGSII
jgi:hypothetical protein